MTDAPAPMQPKHVRIADQIRTAIDSGGLQPGERLEAEDVLAAEYKTSAATINRAVELLKVEGYLEGRRGSGVYRQELPSLQFPVLPGEMGGHWGGGGIWETDDAQSLDIDRVTVDEVKPPQRVARVLRLEAGADKVVRLAARFSVEGRPVRYVRTFLPRRLLTDAQRAKLNQAVSNDMVVTLRNLDQHPAAIQVEARSQMPTGEDVDLLSIPVGRFVLRLYRTAYDDRGPIGVEETMLDTASYVLKYGYTV
ncbi:GntR family transcriptional regulator [Streptomyces sp. NPDC015125]|uniref:GntR family transcriptional regulator n=1 Tax=Streptomyces sp. NPDC015125 TaxID=3364938 RepID=UPI0036FBB6FA